MNNVILFLGLPRANSLNVRNFFIDNEEIHNLKGHETDFLSLARDLKTSEFKTKFLEEKKNIIKQFNDKKNYYCGSVGILSYVDVKNNDIYEGIERISFLRDKNFNIKIILVVRNQSDYIKTYYAHQFYKFCNLNPEFKSFSYFIKNVGNKFYESVNFNKIYKKLVQKFDKENVKILFYEDFINASSKINKDICEFLNINIKFNKFLKTKKTRSNKFFGVYTRNFKNFEFIKKYKILLQIKKYIPKFLIPILKIFILGIQMNTTLRFFYFKLFNFDDVSYNNQEFQFIKKYYNSSNIEFLKSLDLDLKNFEYNKQYLNQ